MGLGWLVASIPPPPGNSIGLGPIDLRLYGLLIATGILCAVALARRRYAATGGNPDTVESVAMWTVALGILGARVGYVIPRLDRFTDDPATIFAIWEGGLTFFGALAGGVLGAWWALRRRNAAFAPFLTAAAPALPLGQAIGRWGNYFNQELYGRPTDLAWALEVEAEHRVSPFEAEATFHPTFLYESLWNFALVVVLIRVEKRFKLRPGSLFGIYLLGYGVGRFWIELLRVDTEFRILGLSRNNINALVIALAGVLGVWWWQRRGSRTPEEALSPPSPSS